VKAVDVLQKAERRLVLLGTGGTIAGRAARAEDLAGYVAGQIGVDALVDGIPAFANIAVDVEQVAQVDSKDMELSVWQSLVERLAHHLARPEVDGVVVTHGTDTLEETAYLLQRLLKPSKPVVMTCAMRPATALAPDGPQNLQDAGVLAQSGLVCGVVVVCAGRVHAAEDVTKRHTFAIDAFDSGDAGPVGVIQHGETRLFRPAPMSDLALPDDREGFDRLAVARFVEAKALPRVEIVLGHAAADGHLVTALLAQSAAGLAPPLRGIVLAAPGNGSIHQAMQPALDAAMASGVQVVRSTRCTHGRVVLGPSAVPSASPLSPVKARIGMMLALMEQGG
jgi:L-asparaginase